MWFNKGNESTDIVLNIIHEIRMVHVQRTKHPPKLRTFRELKRDVFDVAQSMYHGFKRQKLLPKDVEYCIRIPEGYQTAEFVKLHAAKFIGIWFKKQVRGKLRFKDCDVSDEEPFDVNDGASAQKLLNLD
ncbi:hypothetical protein AAMO2058_000191900 [Amorphochlora amoebiformis]